MLDDYLCVCVHCPLSSSLDGIKSSSSSSSTHAHPLVCNASMPLQNSFSLLASPHLSSSPPLLSPLPSICNQSPLHLIVVYEITRHRSHLLVRHHCSPSCRRTLSSLSIVVVSHVIISNDAADASSDVAVVAMTEAGKLDDDRMNSTITKHSAA